MFVWPHRTVRRYQGSVADGEDAARGVNIKAAEPAARNSRLVFTNSGSYHHERYPLCNVFGTNRSDCKTQPSEAGLSADLAGCYRRPSRERTSDPAVIWTNNALRCGGRP